MVLTVEELLSMLKEVDPKTEIHFGGLEFYRIHMKDNNINFEFNQQVYLNSDGKVVVENH